MVDTYTDRLGLIEQEEGTHANEWGDLLNLNLARLDSATRGYISIDVTGGVTLDSNDISTTSSIAQENSFFRFLEFTNTAGTVTVPAEDIMWTVYNNTDGNLTFQPAGGTGVTLTQGKVHTVIYGSNGTTFTDVTVLMSADLAGQVTSSGITTIVDVTAITAQTAATAGDLDTDDEILISVDGALKRADTSVLMGLMYPVGSIYQSTVATNPGTLFGVGTWTAKEDMFLIGASVTYTAASTGGSADAVVVAHDHSAATGSDGTHTHNTIGNHTHTVPRSTSGGNNPMTNSGASTTTSTTTSSAGGHTHSSAGTAHTHTISSDGVSGTNANLPPYEAVYIWERTA